MAFKFYRILHLTHKYYSQNAKHKKNLLNSPHRLLNIELIILEKLLKEELQQLRHTNEKLMLTLKTSIPLGEPISMA